MINRIVNTKKHILSFLFSVLIISCLGQTSSVNTTILSQERISELFPDSSFKQFGVLYPVRRVYNCVSKHQNLYIVITESKDSIYLTDTFNRKIKAFIFEGVKSKLTPLWSINDFTIKKITVYPKRLFGFGQSIANLTILITII